jgi:hypothetical protein
MALAATGCQKNYYSGKTSSKDCGCPNSKAKGGF